MNQDITERDMSFISFIFDNAFYIEKSQLYLRVCNSGIRTVEFIRLKDNKLFFVEAKSTFADPKNSSEKFRIEVKEICEKFTHSLNLFSSVKAGVTKFCFPCDFILPEEVSLVFLLVIKNHERDWCEEKRDALIAALPSYLKKIWKPKVNVINEKDAVKFGIATFSA